MEHSLLFKTIYKELRELSVQAYNGTNSEDELAAIQREINERVQAIDDMGNQAKFNGVNLLDGAQDINLQIGAEDGNRLVMKTAAGATTDVGFQVNFSTSTLGSVGQDATITLSEFSIGSTGVASLSGTTVATANGLTQLDTMINNISRMRSTVGAYENSLQSNLEYLDRYTESLRGARSRIEDADIAAESSEVTKAQILQQSAATMLTQANSTPQLALNLLP